MLDLLKKLDSQEIVARRINKAANPRSAYGNRVTRKYNLSKDGMYYDIYITGGVEFGIIRIDAEAKDIVQKYKWLIKENTIRAYNRENNSSTSLYAVLHRANAKYVIEKYDIDGYTCYDYRKDKIVHLNNDHIMYKTNIATNNTSGYQGVYDNNISWFALVRNKATGFVIKRSFSKKLYPDAKERAIKVSKIIRARYHELSNLNYSNEKIKSIISKELLKC